MAAVKKKQTPKQTPKKAPERPSWSWGPVFRLLRPISLLLVVGLTLVGMQQARLALRSQVARQHAPQVTITPLPPWMAAAGSPQQLLDPASIEGASARRVTQMLEKSSWVRQVKVTRVGTRFQADLEYRQPLLAVDWGDGRYCFADRDGIALDVETLTARGGSACLIVRGARTLGFPAVGEPIADPRVAEVGRLAEKLQAIREPLHLETIVLEGDSSRRWTRVEIRTRSEGRVLWGQLGKNDEKKLALLVERTRLGATLSPGESWDLESAPLSPGTRASGTVSSPSPGADANPLARVESVRPPSMAP
jgi:hypothetical protein